jgi:hypothetical protein
VNIPTGQCEVCIFHAYEFWFTRRRGWRLKPEMERQMTVTGLFRAQSLSLCFREGDPNDIKTFVENYTLEIASPVPWFGKWPMPYPPTPGATWSQKLIPEIGVEPEAELTVRLTGKPFTTLKKRLQFAVRVDGVLLYHVPEVPS